MLIVGEMDLTLTKSKGKGEFHCPTCEASRVYDHRRVKRFLTVYFIPVIPISTVSEHIRCRTCKRTFPMEVASLGPEVQQRLKKVHFANDVRRVMVLTMLADDHAEPAEIDVLRRVYGEIAGIELSDEDIARDIALARRAPVDAAVYCRAIASRRAEDERNGIVRGAFLIASACGEISAERLEQLKQLPKAFGMSEDRFRGIIAEASG